MDVREFSQLFRGKTVLLVDRGLVKDWNTWDSVNAMTNTLRALVTNPTKSNGDLVSCKVTQLLVVYTVHKTESFSVQLDFNYFSHSQTF